MLFENINQTPPKCLVKTVKKCILKKLSIWLTLIKMAIWGINYQKKKNIYIYIREFISYLNQILNNNNNNNNNKYNNNNYYYYYCKIICSAKFIFSFKFS